jgi:hypothetical protein
MNASVGGHVQQAQRLLSEAILGTATSRNGNAYEEGYDVNKIDETRLMGRLRAIRQELEDLEFTEYL